MQPSNPNHNIKQLKITIITNQKTISPHLDSTTMPQGSVECERNQLFWSAQGEKLQIEKAPGLINR